MRGLGGLVALSLLVASSALARPDYGDRLPNGSRVGCTACHLTSGGGDECGEPPCLNPFGEDVRPFVFGGTLGPVWEGSTLASQDPDGDGYTSGFELGDPAGTWVTGAPDPTDGPIRSPGLDDGVDGEDVDECAFGVDDCVALATCTDLVEPMPARRPSFRCTCPNGRVGDGTTGGTGCVDAGGFDGYLGARPVFDGQIVDVDTTQSTSEVVESSCGATGRDVWLHYHFECPSELSVEVVEADFQVSVALFDDDSLGDPTLLPTELAEVACRNGEGTLSRRWARAGAVIRVSGQSGEVGLARLRVSCASLSSHCSSAGALVDGTVEYVSDNPFVGRDPLSDDPCPIDGDKWWTYTVPCTGTVTFGLTEYTPTICEREDVGVAVYREAECETQDTPLACNVVPVDCDEPLPEVRVFALAGEEFLLRAGGTLQHVGSVNVSCAEATTCTDFDDQCDARALCITDNMGALTCQCPVGFSGDGLARGTGCNFDGPCVEAGLTCGEHARCLAVDGGGRCLCGPGYVDGGLTCLDERECSSGVGTAACSSNVASARTVCLEREGSFGCACEAGFSIDTEASTFRCVRRCGDGQRAPPELCDDGNTVDGDGCSASCDEEVGFRCFETGDTASRCAPTCGDGLIDAEAGESCDDGARNSDTRPNACRTDCTLPVCGDGIVDTDFDEVCEPNPDEPSFDCNRFCKRGFGCATSGSPSSAAFVTGLLVLALVRFRRRHASA